MSGMSRFDKTHHFKTIIGLDIAGMLLGDYIGSGAFRDVFAHATSEQHVVKVEDGAGSFHNIAEWETWKAVENTPYAKWFAPCSHISPAGTILVMRRVEHCSELFLPKRVPAFLTDLKVENWGLLDGNPVACDYGLTLLTERALTKAMRGVKWQSRK